MKLGQMKTGQGDYLKCSNPDSLSYLLSGPGRPGQGPGQTVTARTAAAAPPPTAALRRAAHRQPGRARALHSGQP